MYIEELLLFFWTPKEDRIRLYLFDQQPFAAKKELAELSLRRPWNTPCSWNVRSKSLLMYTVNQFTFLAAL